MTEIRNPPMDIFRPYVPDIAGFIEKGDKPGQSCLCTGKIKHTGKSTLIGQFEYLKTLVPEDRWGDIKLTMIAPSWYHLRYKDGIAFPKEIYATDEEYFSDISKAISAELDILYEAGLRNVQFDDPNFACKYSDTTYNLTRVNDWKTSALKKCWQVGREMNPIPKLLKSYLMHI